MKKQTLLLILFISGILLIPVSGQVAKVHIYNPKANAQADINAAVHKARMENKNVLIQVGGNWCPWCLRLHKLFRTDPTVDSLIRADYVWIKVNYSKENKNLAIMKELNYPQRFGFPVLVVLNQEGERIHTQDTGLLESGKGYDKPKVIEFLTGWTVNDIHGNFTR